MSYRDPLGCADAYTVAIHTAGGKQTVVPVSAMERDLVSALTWSRTLRATSTAQAVINLETADASCCRSLGEVEPYMHELTVYRDATLVWQGPITQITEAPGQITFDASDASYYLGRTVNTTNATMASMHKNADLSKVVRDLITLNLQSGYSCIKDWCNMVPYLHIENIGRKYTDDRTDIWVAYVLDIIDKLADRGFEWYVTGRTFVMRPSRSMANRPAGQITADDLGGAVEIVRSADDGATRVYATSASETQAGRTVSVGVKECPVYGRLDLLTQQNPPPGTNGQEPSNASIDKMLRDVATATLRGRYPAPTSFRVTDGATLHPHAPISVPYMMPGERVDVRFQYQCRELWQAMRLTQVQGAWDKDGEKITISLAPLVEPFTDPDETAERVLAGASS